MRILLQFYEHKEAEVSVTALSKMLDLGKTYVSKLVHELSEESFLDIHDPRHPFLTAQGEAAAAKYSETVQINIYRLLKDGISTQSAINDAYLMSFYCTNSISPKLREKYNLYLAKKKLSNKDRFNGDDLCALLPDGEYSLRFLLYKTKDKATSDDILSMANSGFEQPCTLHVDKGTGKFTFTGKTITRYVPLLNKEMEGKISSMQYQDEYKYFPCERIQDMYMIPASSVRFTVLHQGDNTVMHGFVRFKIICDIGIVNMPQSTAICTFTI